MTIIVIADDGNGLPNSNAYAAVAFVDTYHADRLNSYWAPLTADQKASCVIRATDYIDKRFTKMFRGFRMQRDQALAWPRLAAFDNDKFSLTGIPVRLQKAMAEYALRAAIYNVLAPDPLRPTPKEDMTSTTPLGDQTNLITGPVRSKLEKVGPLETITSFRHACAVSQEHRER
jgi:hypothetical protein